MNLYSRITKLDFFQAYWFTFLPNLNTPDFEVHAPRMESWEIGQMLGGN